MKGLELRRESNESPERMTGSKKKKLFIINYVLLLVPSHSIRSRLVPHTVYEVEVSNPKDNPPACPFSIPAQPKPNTKSKLDPMTQGNSCVRNADVCSYMSANNAATNAPRAPNEMVRLRSPPPVIGGRPV